MNQTQTTTVIRDGQVLRRLCRSHVELKMPACLAKFDTIQWPKRCKLLGESTKHRKDKGKGILSAPIYMAPAKMSVPYGGVNACPWASPACVACCLRTSGRLKMTSSEMAMLWKTLLFTWCRDEFLDLLAADVFAHQKTAQSKQLSPAVRFNGLSDFVPPFCVMRWTAMVQWYDYTKSIDRIEEFAAGDLPENYYLVFSRSETNEEGCDRALSLGCGISYVSKLPYESGRFWSDVTGNPLHRDVPIVNGDESDAVFLGEGRRAIWLSAKGKAKDDKRGFAIEG